MAGCCQTSENELKKKGDIQMAKIGVFFSAGYEEIEALTGGHRGDNGFRG